MLISHRYDFIYLRTIKTASTSIELRLQPACLPDGHAHPGEDCDPVMTDAGIIGARRILKEARQHDWWNHMPASQIKAQLDPEIWQGYTKFTSIRNPFAKLVSLFWFKLKQPRHAERRARISAGSFETAREEFLAWLGRHRDIPHDGEIYLIDRKLIADRVIRYEHMDEDLSELISDLGLPTNLIGATTPAAKSGLKQFANPYQDYYDPETRRRVEDRYAFELKKFSYTF